MEEDLVQAADGDHAAAAVLEPGEGPPGGLAGGRRPAADRRPRRGLRSPTTSVRRSRARRTPPHGRRRGDEPRLPVAAELDGARQPSSKLVVLAPQAVEPLRSSILRPRAARAAAS
ncbi:MAG: hypothetical protein BGO49_09385 [Planctomycetales bacterium 71-10]|nr:MAG: hypothetical protein BGO49_09385 [Planctomycetales bacterium 71-10]